MDFLDVPTLYACVTQRWTPGIGDPSVMGWFTVAAYAISGLACIAAARASARDSRFWMILAVALLFLAVNKQLDLQSALTATGRCISQMQGWYEQRRAIQFAFILALLVTSTAILLIAWVRLRHSIGRVGLALVGSALVLTFVAVRAVGFHHFDKVIDVTIAGARMNWILELSGIALIFVNAVWSFRSRRRSAQADDPARKSKR